VSQELPIVCSLTATELPARLAEIEALGRDALLRREADGRLRFRGDERTRERLEAIVAAESQCCAFLDLDLRRDGSEIVLSIGAPAEAAGVADALASAFAGRIVLS
jgi:hypothetical protein